MKLNNRLIPFDYEGNTVRALSVDGEPWFVAADVAKTLGYASAKDFVRGVDEEDKGRHNLPTPSGSQSVTIISEGGLYTAIVKSRTERARPFRRWVTHEVLPAIRRHGGYLTPAKVEEVLSDPDTIILLATQLKDERKRRAELESQVEADAPKVLFADSVASSKSSILVGDLAKILRGNGVEIGGTRLFAWMRERGFLVRRRGSDYNTPTQYAMERGLFEIKETAITHADGHVTVSKTPKVTGKGQQYFINKFLGRAAA
jgi:anti-repressor protein